METGYRQLLSWYASYLSTDRHKAIEHALLSKSLGSRDVFAYIASRGWLSYRALRERATTGASLSDVDINFEWLAALGRVVSLQRIEPTDVADGLALLRISNPHLRSISYNLQFLRLEFELLIERKRFGDARALLSQNSELSTIYHGYLPTELLNPYLVGEAGQEDEWLQEFSLPFSSRGLAEITLTKGMSSPFDRMAAAPSRTIETGGPLITVIMTSYKPDPDAFMLAAKSILSQTWQHLELLVVDDATPGDPPAVLEDLEQFDERVRIIRLGENRGTYNARNVALREAAGDYIAGQDSDDWSHPERLSAQFAFLREHPGAPGVMTRAIRADDDLVRAIPGQHPARKCEVSLMAPTKTARSIGGYLNVRKAADSEFRERLERFTGKSSGMLWEPLYLIRLSKDSLSRGDFGPGWSHPNRRAFWNAYSRWHQTTSPRELAQNFNEIPPIPVPAKFQVQLDDGQGKFDIVLAGDWRTRSNVFRALYEDLLVLEKHEFSIGIMQLDAITSRPDKPRELATEIQDLINDGRVVQVIPDAGSRSSVLLFRDPTLLQFPSTGSSTRFSADRVLFAPDFAPNTEHGEETWYLPEQCEENARRLFGGEFLWANEVPEGARNLDKSNGKGIGDVYDVSPHISKERYVNYKVRRDTSPLVVGSISDGNDLENLSSGSHTRSILSDSRLYDLRILERNKMKTASGQLPTNWILFSEDELRIEAFYRSLDVFLLYPGDQSQNGFLREAFEATAAGCIALLPESFRECHGRNAVYYGSTDELSAMLLKIRQTPESFRPDGTTDSSIFGGKMFANDIKTLIDRRD